MFLQNNILTFLIFLPILGAAGVMITRSRDAARTVSLITCIATLGLSLLLLAFFDWSRSGVYGYAGEGGAGVVQLVQTAEWIPSFNIQYKVGIDGLSFPLVILTTFIFLLALVASWN